jgi:superfamily II DNA or RNA helicase/diadenosine tetraphosphate (Ap4A) HIT family hydrolase
MLVVPRRHFESWFDATPEELAECVELVKVARDIIDASHAPHGYNVGANIGTVAGQTVPHAHLHVIPRYSGDVSDPTGGVRHVIPAKANYLEPPDLALARTNIRGSNGPPAERYAPRRALITGTLDDPLLDQLIGALDRATAVDIVAAFVLQSGVNLLREHLVDVLDRGGRVRVLTGDYFTVTEPSALRTLLDLGGAIAVRAYETEGSSFHPKAYIVSEGRDGGMAFVGSSNLTRTALIDGVEWNYRIVPSSDRAGFSEITESFEALWGGPRTASVDEGWIHAYEVRRAPAPAEDVGVDLEFEPPPEPHIVQAGALEALEAARATGNTAGLVVLATGLGKTWLSAFDSKRPQFTKVLFIAHREEILRQAMRTFRRIRPDASLGIYNGQERGTDADVLFASIQTLSRAQHLHRFTPHDFDYVVVDEFHHAAARTYRRVITYFEPRFLLGLTATPERTDGADLLQLCGGNLVFRADLAEGITESLLCPFDYYGVPDLIDYDNIPWRSRRFDEEALTTAVATQERAENALEQLKKYGHGRTLAFCVSQRHADFMADHFRGAGLRAASVHSGSTSAPRAHSLEQLQDGELDVVCAVDMFNEGVDLPDLNTVLMLRPTESRILWLQQFGRGLRFRPGKRLAVIDYIGNHRIFLTKTQALLGLGHAEREVAYALEQLDAGTWELPPGCSVTYELEAKEILRGLIPRASTGEQLEQYYREIRERTGARPSAEGALFDGFNPRSTRRAGLGTWFDLVDLMGDLSETERDVFGEHEEFFRRLEVTAMTKSYKMVVLLAMLGAEQLPGRIHIDQLVERFQALVRRYTRIRDEVGDVLENRAALRRLILDNPIAAWTGPGAMGGQTYFDLDDQYFATRIQLDGVQREAFADLVHEIVEWRLAEYLQRSPQSRGPDRFVCKVSHSSGRPILFLPSRDEIIGLPEGWVDVGIDGRVMQAKFAKVAVNVVHEKGESENVLPAILRGWFGPNAGAPGTAQHVVFRFEDGTYRMEPLTSEHMLPGGPVRWNRYTREEVFDALGVEANQWERQQGVIERPDLFVFLVTLDKRGKEEAHHYDDAFMSPTRPNK